MNAARCVLLIGSPSPIGRAVDASLDAAGFETFGVSRSGAAGSTRLDVMDVDAVGELLGTVKPAVAVYLARPDLSDAGSLDAAVLGVRRFVRVLLLRRLRRATATPLPATTHEGS